MIELPESHIKDGEKRGTEEAFVKEQNPLYTQIRQHLEQLIEKNRYNPTYMLPSENALANMFQTSRTPVQKVLAALREEGKIYKLQGKGSFIVQRELPGEVLPVYAVFPHVRTPFMQDVLNGMNDYFRGRNVLLSILLTDDDPEEEKRKLEYVVSHNGAGVLFYPIIMPTYHDVLIKLLLKQFNVVVVANYLERLKFSSVHCDYYAQLYRVTERLIREGHKDIAFISERQDVHPTYRARVQAHWECLVRNTDRKEVRLLEINPASLEEMETAEEHIREFLQANADVTAVITMSCVAEAVCRYIRQERGDKETMIVIIDEPVNGELLRDEKVLLLDQMPYQIGWLSAEQLYRQMLDGEGVCEQIVQDRLVRGPEWRRCLTPPAK